MNSITTSLGTTASSTPPSDTVAPAKLRAWLACAALLGLWFGATAWLRPLAIPDEGRYAGVAWEMLRSGDWLVPTLNGQPFFHKPPLFYWLTAASMDLFGADVWAARLASIVAATAAAVGLFAFVHRWAGWRLARRATIVLATMPLFYGGAQYANLDMLVAASIAATILLGAHAALSSEAQRPHRAALALAFAAAALGVLAKGLIGVVLPIIVLLGWGLATSRTRRIGRLLLWPHGWLVFFAIAAPWFIAMQQRFPGFAHYFFVVQHLQRFASVGFNNPQPRWFYPVVLLATTLPWSPWLLALLTQGGARTWLRGGRGDLRALMLVWLVVITAFFSVPDSKLIGYILPALPPLAFLIGDALGSRGAPQRLRLATGVVAATLCVAIVAVEHFYQPKSLAALAARLQADRAAAEPVVFLGNYYYDLPFYARLDAPVLVADRWAPAEVAKDSWRRELVDAEGFAPASARHLVGFDELAPALCGATSAWIVGPWPSSADTPWLSTQQPLYREGQVALWRVRPSSLVAGKCAGLR